MTRRHVSESAASQKHFPVAISIAKPTALKSSHEAPLIGVLCFKHAFAHA